MEDKDLRGVVFPGLPGTYLIPEVDATLSIEGRAADALAVNQKINEVVTKQEQKNGYLDDDIEDLMHKVGDLQTKAEDLEADIANVRDVASKKMEKLWENASPTSEFKSQYIQLTQSAEDYNMLIIIFRYSTGSGYELPAFCVRSENGSRTFMVHYKPFTISGTMDEAWRYGMWIDDPTTLHIYTGVLNGNQNASVCIPIAVYGFNL
jgi:hypothetical protein